MNERHFAFTPTTILDVDNDVDFTFKGMKLWGNRSEKMTQEEILGRFPFDQISVCWTFCPNPTIENLSPIEAIWAGKLDEVLLLAKQKFPTLYKN